MAENFVKLDYIKLYRDKFPLPPMTTDEYMQEFEDMELRDDDIFVVTYPKGGTHWMQEVVNLILVDGHVEKLTSINRTIVIELADVKTFSPEVVAAAGPALRHLKDAPSPRVLPTHVPFQLLPKQLREKRPKMIYVYRNPKDTIVSYYHHRRKYMEIANGTPIPYTPQQFAHFFDAVVSGRIAYGSWFDHVIGYYQCRDDDNFLVVSYEDMKRNLKVVVENVASFIGRPLDKNAINRVVEGASFETMKHSYKKIQNRNEELGKNVFNANIFVNKGKTSQWKDYFTAKQDKVVNDLFRQKMKNCEWTRPYEPQLL